LSTTDPKKYGRYFKTGDGRIRFIKKANGAGQRGNAGIRAAKGQFIAFLDRMMFAAVQASRQMCCFPIRRRLVYAIHPSLMAPENRERTTILRHEGRIFEKLFERNFISTSTVVIRKACIDLAGIFR